MRIRKVSVENFKSFKGQSTVEFSPTTTIIVGKNGSGKSNLLTALHLVICSQKITAQERTEMIHEGNVMSDTACSITLEFDNEDMRFPSGKVFVVKRIIDNKSDSYFLNDKHLTHEEMKGLFESSGLCLSSPYFSIMQGSVQATASMDDEARYNLIRNIAEASKYENDRKASLEILDETLNTQKKIENMLVKVEEKLSSLEKDKIMMQECDALEKEKRRFEITLAFFEVKKLNENIKEIEKSTVQENDENDIEDYDDIEASLKDITEKIDNLLKKRNRISPAVDSSIDIKSIFDQKNLLLSKIDDLTVNVNNDIDAFERLVKENNECFVLQNGKKYLLDYINTVMNKIKKAPENIKEFIDNEIVESEYLLENKKKSDEIILSDKKGFSKVDPRKLQNLIEERKALWREEKKMKQEVELLNEKFTTQENKILLSGNTNYKTYKEIKNEPGVIGCVFELFSVPEELIEAFETVVSRFLFHIVVDNDDIATKLMAKASGNATFIPLNRMFSKEHLRIEDENIFLLSSQVKCDKRFKDLLSYITKNSYLASDIKIGNECSRKHNVNVVTLDGDYVNKNGMIVGGYEKKVFVYKEFKKIIKTINSIHKRMGNIKIRINEVSAEIEICEKNNGQDIYSDRQVEHAKSIIYYLENRIVFLNALKNNNQNKFNVNQLNSDVYSLGFKLEFLDKEIERQKFLIDENKNKIFKLQENIYQINRTLDEFEKYKEVSLLQEEIDKLRVRENELKNKVINDENKIFSKIRRSNLENEKLIAKKHMLYNKRNEICKKAGVSDYLKITPFYLDTSEQDIIDNIKKINEKLKKYVGVNKRAISQWDAYIDQKNAFKTKIEDLKNTYEKITEFILQLDTKKQESLDKVFSMISVHFKYFMGKLSNFGTTELYVEDGLLGIKVNGNFVDTNTLSGGQKTMIALGLTFSIQKIDPSPFYIFDEVDANLDKEGREKVCDLINLLKNDAQYIFTTFREEMVRCGDKFIGVSFSDKMSYIADIEGNVAREFLHEGGEK